MPLIHGGRPGQIAASGCPEGSSDSRLQRMLDEISDLPDLRNESIPRRCCCWKALLYEQRYRIWILHYDKSSSALRFRPSLPWRGRANRDKILAVVGDGVHDAKDRLISMLREQRTLTVGGFDLEPLRVLRSMALDPEFPTIAEPIQLVKVYQSLNSAAFVVPSGKDGRPTLLGRPLLTYEKPDRHPEFRW